ncbi:glutamine--fructose-6-phosphate transaminase [Cognatiyoonia sediminum]|uniref:Glutamine--fructose-6-phosphate transaminase n=1 Tax=Cognatiyoonia sediminum TaxID=1508389 RepID=A0A1M5T545_9RHOB|nr:SIS domain-containing protein [Cognatiyoonia sediminum]SHH45818.1 glutamine--fructose-6-phosphate transaminase [Cognatiyoonia sediminum]
MTKNETVPGHFMATESAQALDVFATAVRQDVDVADLAGSTAFYTIARGSSDAAANILSYEFMRELGVPMTSLPPSVFSLGKGVSLAGSAAIIVSQSGASDDLVRSAVGAKGAGAKVVAITNQPDSPVEAQSDCIVPIGAGPEKAVPATKTVCGSIGAGQAILSAMSSDFQNRAHRDAKKLAGLSTQFEQANRLQSALLRARHVYVIGRDTGYGAAIETALKLKECVAIHAEAYSASEVLHGPLQLATNPLMVLILDTGTAETQDSLDQAEARFEKEDCDVVRIRVSDFGIDLETPAASAALLLAAVYPIILNTALALGYDPDTPATLSKVTQTT